MTAFVCTLISRRSSSRAILMVISDIARACKGQQMNCSIDTVLEFLLQVSTMYSVKKTYLFPQN